MRSVFYKFVSNIKTMITRQEIRIGNSISQGEVDCIHPESVGVLKNNARSFITFYEAEPIFIDEEILRSFGFQNHGNNIFSKSFDNLNLKRLVVFSQGLRVNKWGTGFADYYTGQEKSETLPTELQYVHQLQNLFFALTGEELTINRQGY